MKHINKVELTLALIVMPPVTCILGLIGSSVFATAGSVIGSSLGWLWLESARPTTPQSDSLVEGLVFGAVWGILLGTFPGIVAGVLSTASGVALGLIGKGHWGVILLGGLFGAILGVGFGLVWAVPAFMVSVFIGLGSSAVGGLLGGAGGGAIGTAIGLAFSFPFDHR